VDPDRWEQIQELYHATLERRPSERAAFLAQACADDHGLRGEVESLLAHEGQADGLLEKPAWKHVDAGETTSGPQALATGTQIGVYRIVHLLGVGGMGEVYRATDTKLHRDVAVKVLPSEYADQSEWLSRFHREARALAALNHPCIAAIYGLEESGGLSALAMELAEGPTLAARIAFGPIPPESSLRIAGQIAEALEYAHERGIVHRDLKPANVKVTPEGAVKILDFGLALATRRSVAPNDMTDPPTMTATRPGAIVGTPGYMPPEQATGAPVDRRADIWAFGVVLFEMLSGRRLYPQSSITEKLAAVLRDEPRWGELPQNTPAAIRALLRRCLERDAKRRLRDIGEARITIEDCLAGRSDAPGVEHAPRRRLSPVAVTAVLAAALIVGGVEFTRLRSPERPPPPQTVRFRLPVPAGMTLAASKSFSLSPDGRTLAYLASDTDQILRVWVQPLDSLEPRMLPGTEIRGPGNPPPFWSPDSKFLVFDAGAKLKKVDLTGGPPVTICSTPVIVLGGAWSPQGVIIFGNEKGGLMRVPEEGGTAVPLTTMDYTRQERTQGFPVILPDGRHFLYSRFSLDLAKSGVYVGSPDSSPGEQGLKQVVATPYTTQFVPLPNGNGKLLFLRGGTLWAQELDTSRFDLMGDPARVAESVGAFLGLGWFAASPGTLIYRNLGQLSQLAWFDRQGKRLGSVAEPMYLRWSTVSPDGTRVAMPVFDGRKTDLWIYDVVHNVRKRLTDEPGMANNPLWSPDGKRLIFSSSRGGHEDLYLIATSGEGSAELLYASDDDKGPTSWSADGKFLVYETGGAGTGRDVWILPLETGMRTAAPLLRTPANESSGAFSPAGRWFAYDSDSSGAYEVYIQEFAPAAAGYLVGPRMQVSRGGGYDPHWRTDGKELFYRSPGREIMAVAVPPGTTLQPGSPQRLFRYSDGWQGNPEGDGKRFLFSAPPEKIAAQPFTVVLNWQSELKK
jgi:serine/threonine protein kinase/Tol biopolymer transport system component